MGHLRYRLLISALQDQIPGGKGKNQWERKVFTEAGRPLAM